MNTITKRAPIGVRITVSAYDDEATIARKLSELGSVATVARVRLEGDAWTAVAFVHVMRDQRGGMRLEIGQDQTDYSRPDRGSRTAEAGIPLVWWRDEADAAPARGPVCMEAHAGREPGTVVTFCGRTIGGPGAPAGGREVTDDVDAATCKACRKAF